MVMTKFGSCNGSVSKVGMSSPELHPAAPPSPSPASPGVRREVTTRATRCAALSWSCCCGEVVVLLGPSGSRQSPRCSIILAELDATAEAVCAS